MRKCLVQRLILSLVLLGAQQSAAFVSQRPIARVPGVPGILEVQPKPIDHGLPKSPLQRSARDSSSTTRLQALPASLCALPLSQKIFLSCFLPTCLGFWKSEYGVSYAYGMATALTSFWIYKALMVGQSSSWAIWQACALIFYGVRLSIFLLYRQLCTQRLKDMVERIEDKAKARGGRLQRAPFVLSCAGLYFGLCAPLLISSRVASSQIPAWTVKVLKGLVASTWGGFIFAALGDFNKSFVKAIKGEDHLVTGGIYSLCRHPNYSGEFVSWTSNGLIAIVTAIASKGAGIPTPQLVGYLAASVVGALGLDFVVLGATKGLEKRQKEVYGESADYQTWIESTWAGFELPTAAEEVVDPHVKPEIKMEQTEEDTGSGI
ncbi:Isoprenylcysteine carboxyl methyltransferase (ICMT) family [Seminavis robusta]|uniref:Isoprenylcysteine carboxyl methyltransferase (ICMT) family n=1 Tax=Seminavis robusta TaxID=568900 RepID=A0A9N8EWR5_9STRA|nr:Isoprenylcysteine carboxyl methyltransferase (ICMT) family [Seminavis robusta]|eukprot:Sro1922_g305560.1 Isoprenylcysteine carboxyl methyltransferase (ICMT) family (377) ;mRNA; f:2003-3133